MYHISLDFAHEDMPKLTDGLMVEIACEYMKLMGIVNTQYIVCRHSDKEHQHLHIVANRVDNNRNSISNRNDAMRNVAVCKVLTREYGLHFSKDKMNVKRDRLRGKDKVKYQIYDLPVPVFTSWLTVITLTRNSCCHHARVWNRQYSFNPMVARKMKQPWISDAVPPQRTFYEICIIKWFIDIISPNNDMKQHFQNLLEQYPSVDYKAIGIPQNWLNEPLWT